MATRARIGILTKGRRAHLIQVAYEGYPSYTGNLLKKYYKTCQKVKELLKKGNIIMLEESLNIIETDNLLPNVESLWFVSSASDLDTDVMADYTYIFKEADNTWYLVEDGQFEELDSCF